MVTKFDLSVDFRAILLYLENVDDFPYFDFLPYFSDLFLLVLGVM